ncbi:MAG: hypothetical protein AAGA74_15650 [Pseudomonadota bacterium]
MTYFYKDFEIERRPISRLTIQDVANHCLRIGLNNAETLDCVKAVFPYAKTTQKCIRWYRKKLRTAGEAILTSREIDARRENGTQDEQEETIVRVTHVRDRINTCEPHEVAKNFFASCKRKFGFVEASKMTEALGRSAFWLADQEPNRWV